MRGSEAIEVAIDGEEVVAADPVEAAPVDVYPG